MCTVLTRFPPLVARCLLALDGAEDGLCPEKTLALLRKRNYDYKALTLDVLFGPPVLDLHRRRRRDILSKEEHKQFREALSVVGKNFHLIAQCMVRFQPAPCCVSRYAYAQGRSVHDLMEYYYLWKKKAKFHVTEAHQEYFCIVDAAIRPPRLTEPLGPHPAGKGERSSQESGEESSDSSASCQQS